MHGSMDLDRVRRMLPHEQWRRNRLALYIAAALVFAGFTFVMPFLPFYVRELGIEEDADVASWSGFLLTVAPLLAGLLAPAWGRLGDRYGMKIMVERAMFAMVIHWGFFGFASTVYHVLALRIMLGLFGGFVAVSVPLLVSTTPKEHMSRSIGTLQTVQMISAALGPMIGGTLADWIGIRNTCLVSAAFAGTALLLINRLYKGKGLDPSVAEANRNGQRISFKQAVALPSFGILLLVLFFARFVERSFAPIVPLYILELGTSLSNASRTAGLIISLGLLMEAISAAILGVLMKRTSARRLLLLRMMCGAVICIPMGLAWTTAQLVVLRVLLGLLAGGTAVVVFSVGSRIIPEATRGTSFSILSSASLLGGAAGPILAGFLSHLSLRAIFFFNSVIFLFLFLVSWKSLREH